jgi:hypothetical protein
MLNTDFIKGDTWTSGAAYCSFFVPTLVWCSHDLNVTLPQLQQPALWWNKLLTGGGNNGLGLSATSAFLGKELSSPMNFICQVQSDAFNCGNNKIMGFAD